MLAGGDLRQIFEAVFDEPLAAIDFGGGSGEDGHVLRIFRRNKASLGMGHGGDCGSGRRRDGNSRGYEGGHFPFGAIEGALEAAFLTAELIEGAGVGQIAGGLSERATHGGAVLGELFGDGFEVLLGGDGVEAEFELDGAIETPGGVLDGDDDFAFGIGLGAPFGFEVGCEGIVGGLVFVRQDDGAGEEAGFESVELDGVFSRGRFWTRTELGIGEVDGGAIWGDQSF